MSSVHDNGRVGESPDLTFWIDRMGACAAFLGVVAEATVEAADELVAFDSTASGKLHALSDDVTEALFYLRRALRTARELI